VSTGHHEDDDEARRVLVFCQQVVATLHLTRHELILSAEPTEDDVVASIEPTDARFAAELRLSADWSTLTDEVKVATLVHEVLHLTHAELVHDTSTILLHASTVSQELYGSWRAVLNAHCERWVDRMTAVVMENFDLKYPVDVGGELKSTHMPVTPGSITPSPREDT
jgi:hypothetical protein